MFKSVTALKLWVDIMWHTHRRTQPFIGYLSYILDNDIYKNIFSYQENVDKYSEMWKSSQERSGFEEAIYWIELLIKLKNFDHLKINDGHLNLIQYFCIDVFVLYSFVLVSTLVLLIKVAKRSICVRGHKEIKSKLS